MQRREFITLLGGAAAVSSGLWPLVARAQQGGSMRRLGVLVTLAEDDREGQSWLAAFRQSLEKLGWSEGRNVHIDYRFDPAGGTPDQHQAPARELVALKPDVILAHSTPVATAMQRESRTIPIVFVAVSDPVGSGFIASLARPGGNLTGFLLYEEGIVGKWLGMLKEIAPGLARVAFMANTKSPPYDYFFQAAEGFARSLAIALVPTHVETAADVERAIEFFARLPNGGLLLLPGLPTLAHRDLIAALAIRHRLPAVYPYRANVVAGGLMSYDTDRVEQYRQAATYVDRILRGEKPADLPVQAPVKYETVLNLKTARAFGLAVPDLMLVRADEVIE